jgi:hypothetical protein
MSTSSLLFPSVDVAFVRKYVSPDLLFSCTHVAVVKTATTLLPSSPPPSA